MCIELLGTFYNNKMVECGVYYCVERVYVEYGAKVVVDFALNIGKKDRVVKLVHQNLFDENCLLLNRVTALVQQLSECKMLLNYLSEAALIANQV